MAAMGTHEQIVTALESLKAGAEWSLSGIEYSGLTWIDTIITKPTELEITTEIGA